MVWTIALLLVKLSHGPDLEDYWIVFALLLVILLFLSRCFSMSKSSTRIETLLPLFRPPLLSPSAKISSERRSVFNCSISRFLNRIPFLEIMISMVPGLRLHNSCRLGRKCSFDIDKKLFHWDLMQPAPWNVKIKTQTCILECESKIQTTIWRKIFFQHLPIFFGVEFKMPLLALYCSVVIATVGVLFFLFFRASFSDLI